MHENVAVQCVDGGIRVFRAFWRHSLLTHFIVGIFDRRTVSFVPQSVHVIEFTPESLLPEVCASWERENRGNRQPATIETAAAELYSSGNFDQAISRLPGILTCGNIKAWEFWLWGEHSIVSRCL